MSREGAGRGRKHVRSKGFTWVLASLALVAMSACQDAATASGTALYVTAEFDPLLQLTQFRVNGQVGGEAIASSVLPERPGRILQSGETFRVLLPDAPDGTVVALQLEGLSGTDLAAFGEGEALIRAGYEVDVQVRLEPWSRPPDSGTPDSGTPDGGTPDSGTPDSGTPDAGSFCMNCPDGCCRDGFCVPRTFMSCGVGGVDCTVCDAQRANACSALGACVCGSSPACTGINVDRCDNGQCKCGDSSPCGPGQECVNGQCRCTPGSCPNGCCVGNTCEPGNEDAKCGRGGGACQDCRKECKLPEQVCR